VRSDLTDRVIGISPTQIKKAKRVVALAGGKRKMEAILAALNGRWINVLITDHATARAVLDASETA
jgi:DNA-binding transcriptional regulator LsrR (DeoR family)